MSSVCGEESGDMDSRVLDRDREGGVSCLVKLVGIGSGLQEDLDGFDGVGTLDSVKQWRTTERVLSFEARERQQCFENVRGRDVGG